LNVVIERSLREESIVVRASHCVLCDQKIRWYDLVPLVSFCFLKGKCRACGQKISWQYPLVEIATGLLAMACFYFAWPIVTLVASANWIINFIIGCVLIVIFTSDLRYYLILDEVTIPATIIVFLLKLWLANETSNLLWHDFKYLAVSGVIGLLFFGVQFWLSQGKWIGGGDLRLGAFMGVALGWRYLLVALALAYIIGALVAVFLLIRGEKTMKSKLPLGVFLALGSLVAMFWGEQIINWYLQFLR
jgi:prepilin signal peptidase PulO-like enzyme (type II secretory pathway)